MFRPMADYVLVAPDKDLTAASALIVVKPRDGRIVDSEKQYGRTGTVLATGPGKRTKKGHIEPLPVIPGDRIVFGEFIWPTLDENGEICFVIRDKDITGVIDAEIDNN